MFIKKPPREDIQKFGVLAYVTPEERHRILHLPFGETGRKIKSLEKELKKKKII